MEKLRISLNLMVISRLTICDGLFGLDNKEKLNHTYVQFINYYMVSTSHNFSIITAVFCISIK